MCVKPFLVVYNGKGMTPVCFKIASRLIRPSTHFIITVKTCSDPHTFPNRRLEDVCRATSVQPYLEPPTVISGRPPYNCRESIRYQCPSDCTMIGNAERTCLPSPRTCDDPTWSGDPPCCDCPPSSKILHCTLPTQ